MITYAISEIYAALETMRHDFHFPGHLVPGTAVLLMGLWWIWSAFKIYSENEQRSNAESLLNHEKKDAYDHLPFLATYNGHGKKLLHCEGFYKVFYASFDLFCHLLVVAYGGDLSDEGQHCTVYVFFILNGIVDLILHKKLHQMPDGIDYMASSISWAAFGYLFLSHKHAKTAISIYYHQVLGWLVVAVAVITLMQYKYNKNALISLARGSCCTLVGTWLYQIAFSFHNPFVAANQYRNMGQIGVHASSSFPDTNVLMMETMNAVTIFTWHVILVGSLTTVLGVMATRRKQVYYKRIRHCCV